jgi:two-component system, cell cycle sensor histidine kinase and response regulator CckA
LVDMNAIVEECHTLLGHAFPPSIGFRLDLEEFLWPVEADPSQMSHMIINLCVNARDAILVGDVREDGDGFPLGQGGTITIVTRNHVLDAASATIHVKAVPGPYVHITVSDTGAGMTQEVLDRLFEPFYSTKKMKKNSGLGLSIIYGIVDKLNGFIDVESRLGEGSAFHIYLPRSEASHAEEDVSEEASTSILQESTILIADDEQALLNIAERYLTAHGFEVLSARNGREAVSLFEKEKARIGVVVLDMIMPEMDGETCLKEIRKMDADIDVILMTGFTADKSLIERMKEQSDVLIEKPFDLDRLCKLLKTMTQKRRSP